MCSNRNFNPNRDWDAHRWCVLYKLSTEASVELDEAAAIQGDRCPLRTRMRHPHSGRTSPSSSLIGDEQMSLSRDMGPASLPADRRQRRTSIQGVGHAIVRSTSCFWPKSKTSDKNRYAYGMSEDANDSVSVIMQDKSALSTPTTKRYSFLPRDAKHPRY